HCRARRRPLLRLIPVGLPRIRRPLTAPLFPYTTLFRSADSDDLFENIFHMVLARPEGAGPGTKGLSLFFVPKFHFDPETGELGEDRKSTRLNSSHVKTSYAVFCSKKTSQPPGRTRTAPD